MRLASQQTTVCAYNVRLYNILVALHLQIVSLLSQSVFVCQSNSVTVLSRPAESVCFDHECFSVYVDNEV